MNFTKVLLVLLIITASCQSGGTQTEVRLDPGLDTFSTYDANDPILLMPADTSIPKNFSTAKYINSVDRDKLLMKQLSSYQNAVLSGNVDEAYTFLYKGILDHLRDKFPDYNVDEKFIKENILSATYKVVKKVNETKQVDFNYVIGNILCRHEMNNTLVYVIATSLDANIDGENKSTPSKDIGISSDQGKSWKFMTRDEETTPVILSKLLDKQAIDMIMNCN